MAATKLFPRLRCPDAASSPLLPQIGVHPIDNFHHGRSLRGKIVKIAGESGAPSRLKPEEAPYTKEWLPCTSTISDKAPVLSMT
ncbi:MAG TPA: hypothetical protein VGN44_21555 [Candidatus Angelobacter sp.]|jgi:hypothetical protein